MTFTRTHRRFALGLLLALAAALALEAGVLARARAGLARQQAERSAVVPLAALAELAGRAGGTGEPVRQAAARFAEDFAEDFETLRVIDFAGRSLEASTVPEDTGDRTAPRRMVREEKDLYDQGQRLRQAVETNRQEGVFRKDEIEITPGDAGGLALAMPVEVGGEVTGAVLAVTAPRPASPRPGFGVPLLLAVAALGLFALAAALVGERKAPLSVAAAAVLLAAVAVYAVYSLGQLHSERLGVETAVAQRVVAARETAGTAATELGFAEPPLDPAVWDTDTYRRPFGVIDARGGIDEAALTAAQAGVRDRLFRFAGGAAAVALALLFFFGLGGASHLGETLVRHRQAYLYTLPALAAMVVLVFLPFSYGIALSFTDSTLYNQDQPLLERWIGLDNYTDILSDTGVVKRAEGATSFDYENFYWTLGFTVVWTVLNVGYGVTLGLLLALALNRKGLTLKPVYRVLLILPWAVPNYITALIWKGMFHQQFGVINQVVQMLGLKPVAWFENPVTSFLAIWATNGWLSFPFMMVISLGALQSIPGDLYEAAKVDGANRWQQFRSITLPSLKPALVPAVIISVIWTFNMFNIPYLTSGGEPAGATEILITDAYKIAFQKYQYGYAAAYATVIFLILLAYGTWQNRVTRATESIG